jgi:phosphoglycolate phosphatase
MSKTIIFDFDGTLADSLGVLIKITNDLGPEFGITQIAESQIAALRRLSSQEIIKMSGIALWQIPFLLRRFQVGFQQRTAEVELFPGVEQMLHELKFSGYKLGIVSSNSVRNIGLVLRHHQVEQLFSFIQSCSVFGKGRAIRSIMRANYVEPTETIYVGDEVRDIEAARRSKVSSVAVTWGFNAAELLVAQQPDYLVHSPHEIVKLLQGLLDESTTQH